MARLRSSVMVSLLLLGPALAFLPTAWADGGQGLEIEEGAGIAGRFHVDAASAGLHNLPVADDLVLGLEASRLDVELTYRRGVEVGHPGADPVARQWADGGTWDGSFLDAEIDLVSQRDEAEFLAFPDHREPHVEIDGTGEAMATVLTDGYVTRAGQSPDAQEARETERIGFWYQPPAPQAVLSGGDRGTVTGNFTLFLHNVTVSVSQDSQEVWRNWTGHRRDRPDQPVSGYENRILLVDVTNGRLTVEAKDGLEVLAPVIDAETVGALTSEVTQGRMTSQAGTFLFSREPLMLEGRGGFTLAAPTDEAPGRGLSLSVDPDAAFEVRGGQPVAGPEDRSLPGAPSWPVLLLVGTLVAGSASLWLGRRSDGLLAAWRTRRYTRWMERGRDQAKDGAFASATTSFRRATRADPSQGMAWFQLALATLEDRDAEGALGIVDEIRGLDIPVDGLDLLEIEASAALRAGHLARCRDAMGKLLDRAPAMARSLARDLDVGRDELGDALADELIARDEPGGLPGYV